ncbi:MAG: hypothetical protein AAGA02_03815 [Bacteroidota bacterium]
MLRNDRLTDPFELILLKVVPLELNADFIKELSRKIFREGDTQYYHEGEFVGEVKIMSDLISFEIPLTKQNLLKFEKVVPYFKRKDVELREEYAGYATYVSGWTNVKKGGFFPSNSL